MKQYSIIGKSTGRMGAAVFSVRKGVQIVRERPISVFNPSTPAQVAQRAKMKLASQASGVLESVIQPFTKAAVGLQSARNVFVKALFDDGAMSYSSDRAVIDVTKIRLTAGVASPYIGFDALPHFSGTTVTASISPASMFRGGYLAAAVIGVRSSGVTVLGSVNVAIPATGNVSVSIDTAVAVDASDRLVFYAMKTDVEKITASYGNMSGVEFVAMLNVLMREIPSAFDYSASRNVEITAQ